MIIRHSTFSTPFGPFSAAIDTDDALVATAFGDSDRLRTRFAPFATPDAEWTADAGALAAVRDQVLSYAANPRHRFSVRIATSGSAFQQKVWAALRDIPCGETRSYGDLARALQTAPRAVGRANATNPVCLLTPCHRVIGADGTLTGFAFGEAIKARLLQHEGNVAAIA